MLNTSARQPFNSFIEASSFQVPSETMNYSFAAILPRFSWAKMIWDAESWSFIDINKTSRRCRQRKISKRRHTFLCVAFIFDRNPNWHSKEGLEPSLWTCDTSCRDIQIELLSIGVALAAVAVEKYYFLSNFHFWIPTRTETKILFHKTRKLNSRYQSQACARRLELEGIFGCAEKLSRTEKLWNHFLNSIKPSKRATPKAGNMARQSSKCLFCYLLPSRHNSA